MAKDPAAPPRPKKPPDPLGVATVGQLVAALGIPAGGWDALVVGDGSGTGWDHGCGWSAVLIDHYTGLRQVFNGAANHGTSHVAELAAYVFPLMWYAHGPGRDRPAAATHRVGGNHHVAVHLVTDKQTVANQGNGACRRDAGQELWGAIDKIVKRGYRLHWHWLGRDRLGLNRLTDHLSRQARLALAAIQPPPGLSIYDFNPPDAAPAALPPGDAHA